MAIGSFRHSRVTDDEAHVITRWQHVDTTARLAETVATGDVGKISHQLDNDSFWVLQDLIPTWIDITAGGGIGSGDVVGPASSVSGGLAIFDGTTGKLIEGSSGIQYSIAGGRLILASAAAEVRIAERTTGPTPGAGNGGYWVRDDAPTQPMFTDDIGTDVALVGGPASATNDSFALWNGTTGKLIKNAGAGIAFTSSELRLPGLIRMNQIAAPPSPISNRGHLWVKDEVPNTLYFSDDAGNATIVSPGRGTVTLGVAATTFLLTHTMMEVAGDGGANTLATITGAGPGQILTLLFVDALVTITDDNTHAADSVDLSAAFTSADDTILQLIYDGVSWYEVSRSVN